MSLKGQWIARYTGNSTGTVVLDLDEFQSHYRGTAIAWNDNSELLNSLVRIRTLSKAPSHRLQQVPVTPIYANGNVVPPDVIDGLRTSGRVLFPDTADIEVDLKGENLDLSWQTPVGSFGKGSAVAPKTRGGAPSELEPHRINKWDGFKNHVNKLERRRYAFRGQESSEWRLRTSFYRAGRSDLEKYQAIDINNDLNKLVSGLVQHTFDFKNPQHYLSALHLAQHHGYPTPLLDWTWSPYVAAFFAFRNIRSEKMLVSRKKVRIFNFDTIEWNRLIKADKIFPFPPHVTLLDPLAFANNRAIPQQSHSAFSNVDDIETHIQGVERHLGKKFLEVFEFPVRERGHIMHELALMGITAGSLLPGLDGAFESLREQNFS